MKQIDDLTEYPTPRFSEQNLQSYTFPQTKALIAELHKDLHKARNLENNAEYREHINYYIK